MTALEELFGAVKVKRSQHRSRLVQHLLAQMVCLGKHTVTGLLSVCGRQFDDWSAAYRMYNRDRVEPERLFDVVRAGLCATDDGPVVVALDDTCVKKTGKKVHGAKYTRDPMGPPFHVNFIWAQRFVQLSMALKGPHGQARMIPVDWRHAPRPPKPGKQAEPKAHALYKQQCNETALTTVGGQRIANLRLWMDRHQARERALWALGDGSFTNGPFLKQLPPNTVFVGRIRADAKLFHLPAEQPQKGRRRVYGKHAPTPEELRQDDAHPWKTLQVFFGGQERTLRAKRLTPLRWPPAGGGRTVQLIVIAPTGYRLSPNTRRLYRKPAYLICTDPDAPLKDVVQRYLWRWDIETNFRDQKTLLGVGQAQVRTPAAVQNVTATAVAAYAMLLLAAHRCRQNATPIDHLPAPKWQRRKPQRATTMNLIQNLRHELWATAIHFSGFVNNTPANTNPKKCIPNLQSALFYAQRH